MRHRRNKSGSEHHHLDPRAKVAVMGSTLQVALVELIETQVLSAPSRPLLQTCLNMFKQAASRRDDLFSHRVCEGSFVLLLFLIFVFFSGTIHF